MPARRARPRADVTAHDRDRKSVTVESLAGHDRDRIRTARRRPRRDDAHVARPGLAEHGVGFKDLADAIALRNHVLLQLERASIHPGDPSELGFVFVGAGYAGVEALAELNDMAQRGASLVPALREVPQRWVLVDAAPKILPEIPRRLGSTRRGRLATRGVEIHVGTTLESYDGTEAVLADGMRIPARTLVWTAGVRASPLLPSSGSRSTSAVASSSTRRCASREPTTSGHSATARR